MALQLRSRRKSLPNPSLIRYFSDKRDPDAESPQSNFTPDDADSKPQSSTPPSSFSTYLSDVKARLKQQQQHQQKPQQQQHNRPTFSSSFPASNAPKQQPSTAAALREIRKNLAEFRSRSAAPDPGNSNVRPVTFQELYKRNVTERNGVGNSGGPESGPKNPGAKLSLDAIRQSLNNMRSSQNTGFDALPKSGDPMSHSRFRDVLNMRPGPGAMGSGSKPIGGGENLPMSVFDKELRERKEGKGESSDGRLKTEFLRMYSYSDLGGKLKMLRPESTAKGRDGKGWFSLEELNERLVKLREMEEKESESQIGIGSIMDLRASLTSLKMSDDEKMKKTSLQRLNAIAQFGGTPDFMLQPPKEQLVEKYFHPDNMSSAEKLKIQLAEVRDEFKMSESDCGSARVQVAQLTTKIKHLAKVLHKKDKHSRKGLEAMVQQRKRLLKYLRRTDWDSYCLVLSKLGLRDNPDYKKA